MNTTKSAAKSRKVAHPPKSRKVPRRTPPTESTSLPAHKKQELALEAATGTQAQDPSKQHNRIPNEETRDSNGSDESAGKWFDKANKHGPQGQRESPSTDG
jgi:hypothetical protein